MKQFTKLSPQVSVMLANGSEPSEHEHRIASCYYRATVDPKLARLIHGLRMTQSMGGPAEMIADDERQIALLTNLAIRVGDAAFFEQMQHIVSVHENAKRNEIRYWVKLAHDHLSEVTEGEPSPGDIAGMVNAYIPQRVDARRVVDELRALGLK